MLHIDTPTVLSQKAYEARRERLGQLILIFILLCISAINVCSLDQSFSPDNLSEPKPIQHLMFLVFQIVLLTFSPKTVCMKNADTKRTKQNVAWLPDLSMRNIYFFSFHLWLYKTLYIRNIMTLLFHFGCTQDHWFDVGRCSLQATLRTGCATMCWMASSHLGRGVERSAPLCTAAIRHWAVRSLKHTQHNWSVHVTSNSPHHPAGQVSLATAHITQLGKSH